MGYELAPVSLDTRGRNRVLIGLGSYLVNARSVCRDSAISDDGWALFGDAGYHRDPITAQGMSDALRQAEWLAKAICAGLDVGGSAELAFAEFQRQRDEAFLPMYHLTHDLARLEPVAAFFGSTQLAA